MLESSLGFLVLIITLAFGFGISNGFNDAANAIATVVGTRTLSPRNAIIMAAFCNLAGALTGTAVALTIGKGILAEGVIAEFGFTPLIAALASVIIWNMELMPRHSSPIRSPMQSSSSPKLRVQVGEA